MEQMVEDPEIKKVLSLFEKVKDLFEVSTKEAFVSLIQGLPDKIEQDYRYRIPHVKEELCVDKVCTLR